jgi:sigma-B regulation protein RsbU (phosphoserine phosphatase)
MTDMPAPNPAPIAPAGSPLSVLVVDDSRAQRMVLSVSLKRWGYRVVEAASGAEALALCRQTAFDIVLSDWIMPGLSGLELCRAFRALPHEGYGYFILLTSKSEKTEIADGLDCGADDFLTKPVNADELRARIRAGERVIGMQRELVEKNRLVGRTLKTLQALYDSLDRDLIEARKLQQSLVRDRHRILPGAALSLLLRPSGHVGGDLAGWFEITDSRLALYSVDVSGHGVASAMMTARLAGLLSGASPDQNLALRSGPAGQRDSWPPDSVADRFNRMMIDELKVDQYFTLAYAEVDLASGALRLVQAGHPHPLILRAGGGVERLGDGGLPIGLIPGAEYETISARLCPGDRLFLMSDGLTECPGPDGTELGEAGLIGLLTQSAHLDSPALLEALVWDLSGFCGPAEFPDDISGVILDYRGLPGPG